MFATVNGVRLHYAIEGEGSPLLVVSAGGSPIYQRTLSPRLREHFQLIFLDLRGSGPSEVGPLDGLTRDTFLDDIDGVRHALGLERVIIFGHSIFARVALAYAHKYPTHAAGAVSVGINPRADDQAARDYWETMASPERKGLLARNIAALDESALGALPPHEAFIARYLARGPERFRDPAFDWAFFWEGCTFSMAIAERMFALFGGEYDLRPLFPHIPCPVFIATGAHDYPCPPTAWAGQIGRFPRATYRVFERSGHNPQYEESDLFADALIAWAREID